MQATSEGSTVARHSTVRLQHLGLSRVACQAQHFATRVAQTVGMPSVTVSPAQKQLYPADSPMGLKCTTMHSPRSLQAPPTHSNGVQHTRAAQEKHALTVTLALVITSQTQVHLQWTSNSRSILLQVPNTQPHRQRCTREELEMRCQQVLLSTNDWLLRQPGI